MNTPADLSRRAATGALLISILVGAALRLHRLDALPLWNDECIQLNGIQMPMAELRARHLFTIDHMPPFSYWIQRLFWLISPTVFAARLPGALAGIAMIPLAYRSLRPRLSRRFALAAALLTALSFFLIFYSQECRAYIFFGGALWFFLGDWLRLLLHPANQVPAPRALLRWFAGALLCGAFHFSASLLFVCVGIATAVILGADAAFQRGVWRERLRSAFRRGAPMAAVLFAALGVVWLAMRYFLGPKMSGMIAQARADPATPEFATVIRALLPATFGGGWRLLPFGALVALGWAAPSRAARRAAFAALALFAVSVAAGLWLFPRLGFWRLSGAASRYYFWWSWCGIVAAAAGVERLARFSRRRLAALAPAVVGLAALVSLAGPCALYFRSESKWFDVRALQRTVEALGERRPLLLHNPYDAHQLQFYWPSNARPAAPPAYERDTYEAQQTGVWLREAVNRFPDAVFKTSWHRALDADLEAHLRSVFARRVTIAPDPALAALHATGLLPLDPVAAELFFNTTDDLEALASEKGLVRFDADWPIVSTRSLDGRFEFWRALTGPGRLRVRRGGGSAAAEDFTLAIGRLAERAAIIARRPGIEPVRYEVAPAALAVFDERRGAPVWVSAGIGAVVAAEGRVPMQIERARVVVPLPPERGRVEIELAPEGAPVLVEAEQRDRDDFASH